MQQNTIHLAVVNDHTIVRKALIEWVSQYNGFKVTIGAADTRELLNKLNTGLSPDVLLLAALFNITESIQLIRHYNSNIKIIVMSMHFDPQLANELLELGIHGYLSNMADTSELLQAIKTAYTGMVHQNKILTDVLNWRANNPQQYHSYHNRRIFTENQRKILQLLWEEKSTKEIADEIFLSVSAVEKIKQQLKEQTGAKTTLGLIKFAIEQNILRVQPTGELNNNLIS